MCFTPLWSEVYKFVMTKIDNESNYLKIKVVIQKEQI